MVKTFTRSVFSILIFSLGFNAYNVTANENEILEAKPKLRFPSVMPPWATESGYCCMVFDIDKHGHTKNVGAAFCSSPVFWEPSIRAAKKWRYYPKTVNEHSVESKNETVYHSYRLHNLDGSLIRNADGYPQFDKEGEHLDRHYCSEYIS